MADSKPAALPLGDTPMSANRRPRDLRRRWTAPCYSRQPRDHKKRTAAGPTAVANGRDHPRDQQNGIQEQPDAVDPQGRGQVIDQARSDQRPDQGDKPRADKGAAEPQRLPKVELVPVRGVVAGSEALGDGQWPDEISKGDPTLFVGRMLSI
jgi:hypothetical protein